MRKVIDIETNTLLAKMLDFSSFPYKLLPSAKLHVVVIRDVDTDQVDVAEGKEITREWMQQKLDGCTELIHHNGIKFDLVALQLFGVLDYRVGYLNETDTLFGKPVVLTDTLIWSRLFNPDRYGGHSLHEWGKRTGYDKMDFRGRLIEIGALSKDDPKGAEFETFHPIMTEYCIDDTLVGKNTYLKLIEEREDYAGWNLPIKMEHKLADLAIRRESLGFWFDKEAAVKCVADLTQKMEELQAKVNPMLPPKPMTKTEIKGYTPPKNQLTKAGVLTAHMKNFIARIEADLYENDGDFSIGYKGKLYKIPFTDPVETHVEADISHLDHVKSTLIYNYGWEPTEWAERDFTKDSKKVSLPYQKRIEALTRWFEATMGGKYKEHRLDMAMEDYRCNTVEDLWYVLTDRLKDNFPVRLPTSPKVRVGVEKNLCPALINLGEKVSFAADFALYLTYKHRKSCIAGGEIEDMDFDEEVPNTGYLASYREIDGRIPTPAIEIGAATGRYRHIGVN